jgi:RimJ/RimL family protein N-acetyltransferase
MIAARGMDILFRKDAKPIIKAEGGDPAAAGLVGPNQHIKPVTQPWPGYDFPITFRQIEMADTNRLAKVMKDSAEAIRGFVSWGSTVETWEFKQVQAFVNSHVNADWPRFHLLFFAGDEIVGFGSIAPMGDNRTAQVALWVANGHQGKGIGKWITLVMEWYAFQVFGFDAFYYQFDSANGRSGLLPERLEYQYSHSFYQDVDAEQESGLWHSFVKYKPNGTPLGFIDTGDYGNWGKILNPFMA